MFGASFILVFNILFTENKQKIFLCGKIKSAQKVLFAFIHCIVSQLYHDKK